MMPRMMPRVCLLPLVGIALSWAALADEKVDENKDLDLIPAAAQAPAAPSAQASAPTRATSKIFLENAFTQSWLRGAPVPVSPPQPPAWQERSEERRVGKECRSRWSTYD